MSTSPRVHPSTIDLATRVAIADAVDEAARSAFPDRLPELMCHQRAFLALPVVCAVTKRTDWRLQAGSLMVATGVEDFHVGWNYQMGLADGITGEYHVWLALGLPGYEVVIVDPSTRYFPDHAESHNTTWSRGVLPIAWDSIETLTAAGYHYAPEVEPTARVTEEWNRIGVSWEGIELARRFW